MTALNPIPARDSHASALRPGEPPALIEAGAELSFSRPQPIIHETFEAFRLKASGEITPRRATDGSPIPILNAASVDECVAQMTMQVCHKDQFLVRHVDRRRDIVTLHVYQVKRQARGVGVLEGHKFRTIYPQYAELVSTVQLPGTWA